MDSSYFFHKSLLYLKFFLNFWKLYNLSRVSMLLFLMIKVKENIVSEKKGGEQSCSPPQYEDNLLGLLFSQLDIAAEGGKLDKSSPLVNFSRNLTPAYLP